MRRRTNFVFQETSERELYSGQPGGRRNYAHAIERIEPEPNSKPVELTVHLTRGATVAVNWSTRTERRSITPAMLSRLHIYPELLHLGEAFPKMCWMGNFKSRGLAPDKEYPFISWTASGDSARRSRPKPAWVLPAWCSSRAARRKCGSSTMPEGPWPISSRVSFSS